MCIAVCDPIGEIFFSFLVSVIFVHKKFRRTIVTWIVRHLQTLHYYTKALSLGIVNISSVHTNAQNALWRLVVPMYCKHCTTLVVRT